MREQKYHLLRVKYDEFKMLSNENCKKMYSHLNIIVKDINALDVAKIDRRATNRKILMLLPKIKYNIVSAMLQKEKLNTIELLGEIRAHEMSILGMEEEASQANQLPLRPRRRKAPSSR